MCIICIKPWERAFSYNQTMQDYCIRNVRFDYQKPPCLYMQAYCERGRERETCLWVLIINISSFANISHYLLRHKSAIKREVFLLWCIYLGYYEWLPRMHLKIAINLLMIYHPRKAIFCMINPSQLLSQSSLTVSITKLDSSCESAGGDYN